MCKYNQYNQNNVVYQYSLYTTTFKAEKEFPIERI